ncbi:MAG: hypothetical protein ABH864_06025 [archaeon]
MITKQELRRINKFDTHSHIGADARNTDTSSGDLERYCAAAKEKNITRAVLIGVPLPRYQTAEGVYTPVNWEVDRMKMNTYSEIVGPDGKSVRGPVRENPFAESNERLAREVEEASSSDLSLHFAPHVHPLLDTQEHLKSVLKKKPIAVKIHGSSWGIDPRDIPAEFFEAVRKYDVPLILHTDYNTQPHDGRQLIQRANDPLNWINVCREYEVRASLAHGLRLCEESWEKVKESGDQFLVGFGPRLTTREEDIEGFDPKRGYRVKKRGGDYVTDLMEMADPSKLAYDVDFAWNRNDNGSPDWNMDEELIGKMPDGCFKDFYRGNAERFYRMGENE